MPRFRVGKMPIRAGERATPKPAERIRALVQPISPPEQLPSGPLYPTNRPRFFGGYGKHVPRTPRRRRFPMPRLELAGEAAGIMEAAGLRQLGDRELAVLQQVAGALHAQPHRRLLQGFLVDRVEGLGQPPAREPGQLHQVLDPQHPLWIALEVQPGLLDPGENPRLRPLDAGLDPAGQWR